MDTENVWKVSVLKTPIFFFIFLQELLSKLPLSLIVLPSYITGNSIKVDVREIITSDILINQLRVTSYELIS